MAEAAQRGSSVRARSIPRWTISFADLALLLLSSLILLNAGSAHQVAAGARAAFPSKKLRGPLLEEPAFRLFDPGEARLKSGARARIVGIGRTAAANGRALVVESHGRDPAGRRFDAWELAAARAAALARALSEGGVAEDRVRIVIPERGEEDMNGQTMIVRDSG